MITRTDVLARMERGIKVNFLAGIKTYTPMRSAFTSEPSSDGAFEIYSDMGAVPWPRQNGGQAGGSTDSRTNASQVGGIHMGGPIVVLGGNERALIVYNQDWDVAIGIEHNAINDDRVGGLEQWAQSAGSRFEQHKDFLAFDALNQGEATTTYGAGYDKLALFSTAHIDPNGEYVTGQSNKLTTALTLDNFEAARVAAGKFKDDRGQPYGGLGHTLLIHSLDLERTAEQITDNVEDYSTTNRAKNPYAGKISRLGAPGGWLDTTAAYLVDVSQPQKPIILQVRQEPQLVFWDDHSQGSGIRYYKWVARYAPAYGNWRLIIQINT